MTRRDLAVSVSIDDKTLVDSRSVTDTSHEVVVWTNPANPRDRRAVRCSCWLFKRGRPCPHRAYVAIRLWEDDMGADLSEVGARALVSTLLNAYLDAPKAPRVQWWLSPPGDNERPYDLPEPDVA